GAPTPPWYFARSEPQSPTASTWSTAPPGGGSGSGNSRTSWAPLPRNTAARTLALIFPAPGPDGPGFAPAHPFWSPSRATAPAPARGSPRRSSAVPPARSCNYCSCSTDRDPEVRRRGVTLGRGLVHLLGHL